MVSAQSSLFESPQCLISTDGGGQLTIQDKILDQVRNLDKPLVIIAIIGLYRTGKSFLMNRLARKATGFSLGATIEAKTKGIWIWAIVHPHDSSRYLLLLDTEGLGDAKKADFNHDMWLFSLATLLSSVLVYNGMGNIDTDAIEKLRVVSDITRLIKRDNPGRDIDWKFPLFIYALRDFSLELSRNGKPITKDEYLEYALEPSHIQDCNKDVEKFNDTRKHLKQYFKDRKCFTFDRPGTATVLREIESLDDSKLSAEFLQNSDEFCQFIYENAPVHGQGQNGSTWAVIVKVYVQAIREGKVPRLENAYVALAEKIKREKKWQTIKSTIITIGASIGTAVGGATTLTGIETAGAGLGAVGGASGFLTTAGGMAGVATGSAYCIAGVAFALWAGKFLVSNIPILYTSLRR